MSRTRTWFLAAALTLIACQARAGEAPPKVDRATRIVRAEAARIMTWVYPTVTLDNVGGCSAASTENAFTLACRFNYTDADGDKASRLLSFDLESHGLITAIRDSGGDSIVPPFFWLRFTKELVAEMARDELLRHPERNSDADKALLRLLAGSPRPEEVLAFLLDVEIAAT